MRNLRGPGRARRASTSSRCTASRSTGITGTIDEWPAQARRDPRRDGRCRSGSREVGVSTFGAEEVQEFGPAAHRRAADRPRAAHPLVQPATTCRAPGRRRRATARPRARPTTATSTWACCARTARRSSRCRHFAELHAGDRASASGSTSRITGSTTPCAGCKRLGVQQLRTGLSWADSFRPGRASAGSTARWRRSSRFDVTRDLLLHAGAARRPAAPHQPAAATPRVRRVLRAR